MFYGHFIRQLLQDTEFLDSKLIVVSIDPQLQLNDIHRRLIDTLLNLRLSHHAIISVIHIELINGSTSESPFCLNILYT